MSKNSKGLDDDKYLKTTFLYRSCMILIYKSILAPCADQNNLRSLARDAFLKLWHSKLRAAAAYQDWASARHALFDKYYHF